MQSSSPGLNQNRRMDAKFTFTVNGQSRTVSTDPQRPLLDVLREDLQLTGAKYGCGEGQCRACTVLLNGKAVASCMTPVAEADKQTIVTIEGLASGDKLHPVQEAFLAEGAFQCGYCTPGMILGTVGLLNELPNPSEEDILSRMQRHLCRCCHYPKLLKAIRRAAGQTEQPAAPR
jgi:aerobic carbon-monoxide dehydrogenase small subunit